MRHDEEFFGRVAEKEGGDEPVAVFHARAVIDVLRDAVGDDTGGKAVEQLPDEYRDLFESSVSGELTDRSRPLGTVSRNDWDGTSAENREGRRTA